MDISDRVWWTEEEIYWRGWDYPLRPLHHTVRISDITRVETALHPANFNPSKPFDRILFISPADTVVVLPSFHRREELEELLRIVRTRRPDAVSDPNVIEFIDGGFTDWWRYR